MRLYMHYQDWTLPIYRSGPVAAHTYTPTPRMLMHAAYAADTARRAA